MIDRAATITGVQTLWRRLGCPPRARDWDAWPERPCSLPAIYRQFGSWTALLEESDQPDLPQGMPRHPPGTPSRSRVLNALMPLDPQTLSPLERQRIGPLDGL